MRNGLAGKFNQAVGAVGERLKTWSQDHRGSSTNSRAHTSGRLPFVSKNGNDSEHTPTKADSNPEWSSSSKTEPHLSSLKIDDDYVERERPFTLTIHLGTFGKRQHIQGIAYRILKDIDLKYHLDSAYLDNEEVNCDPDFLRDLKTV